MFNSFHWQVDMLLMKDDICTLVNAIIVDPMWTNLLPRFCLTQGFATSDMAQAKRIAIDTPLINSSFLAIEVFG
jgi:hypothetical protein